MKIAFVGKGGSGKTTLAGIFARVLGQMGIPVLAVDADINQHLLLALSGDTKITPPPPLGIEIDRIKKYLAGTNARIQKYTEMIKTTPPGKGSVLMRINEENPLYEYFVKQVGDIRFMATGGFTDEDLGVKCYHSKTGAVELLLNHIVDSTDEFMLVDMTAGADAFASGLFTRFDATFVVVEPTQKSLSVFLQYQKHAEPFGLAVYAIGNKVNDKDDEAYLYHHLGSSLVGIFQFSPFVRAQEKGVFSSINELEVPNRKTIETLIALANSQKKDWAKYQSDAVYFHKKNAESWANAAMGIDLANQIDPDFHYPPPL